MASPSVLYPKKVDLTNCDKEPIHLLGKIQDHSMLFVFKKESFELVRVSENVFNFFSHKREEVVDLNFTSFFDDELAKRVLEHINKHKDQPLEVQIDNDDYVIIPHHTEELFYIELEKLTQNEDLQIAQHQLSQIISSLSEVKSVEQMCTKTATLIKGLLEYDRVMVYQFDENWNGRIVAESRATHLDSWIGMHYPATDIPQQARALFLKQGVRIISDVDSNPVDIYPELDKDGHPLDLSRCEARAVSPIHIEYLKNMKVSATLNAAIISNGELWGLISCHHYSPRFINYYQRLSVKFLTQVFSTQLSLRASNESLTLINDTFKSRSILIEQMSSGWDVHKGLTRGSTSMLTINESSGGAIFIDGKISLIGDTPSELEVEELIDWVYDKQLGELYSTQSLPEYYDKSLAFAKIASGVLCIFITKGKKDCLLWFKPELRQTISWGGNPDKAIVNDDNHLSPRKSFDRWNKEQKNTSLPWQDYEISSAKALRDDIKEIIINKYDEIKELNEKLQGAYKEMESFSYSVSHDLRSPLRGIDGFAQILKEDYYDLLDDFGKTTVQTIIDSARKMNDLIDDILSFSGVGTDRTSMDIFSMKEVVNEVIEFLNIKTQYPKAIMRIQDNLSDAYGDRAMIFQLLNNLITNAVKYSKNVDQPIIEIGAIEAEGQPIYFVKDNGIGFDNQYAEKIFGVFNRLVKDEFEGSGIGLAIAQKVIDKHKGKIWAKSEKDNGATFYFQLPKR